MAWTILAAIPPGILFHERLAVSSGETWALASVNL
jgi:hypothetical protein